MEENKNMEVTPQMEAPQEAKAQPRRPQTKKQGMNFGTTFLATLLAVVAGSVVTFVFWIVVFSGLSAAFQTEPTTIPESAILKIDLKESIVDAPSKNPMASFDFNTLQTAAQVTLFNAL